MALDGTGRYTEAAGEARWSRAMDGPVSDIRYTLRALRRNPLFTVVAVATISIGTGATTAVSSLLSSVLLDPLPSIASPERLYDVTESRSGMTSSVLGYVAMEYPRYQKYEAATSDVWSGLVAHRYTGLSLAMESGAMAVDGSLTSPNYFDVLGVRPALGRFYGEGDTFAAVLGHALWASRFGSDPDVIGRAIRLDGRTFTIVGVAPAEFTGTSYGIRSDVWAPLRDYWAGNPLESFDTWVAVFGRLADGIELPQAMAAVRVAAANIEPEQSWTTVRSVSLDRVTGIPVFGRTAFNGFLAMLLGTATLVLLIAAANVANMLLARATARSREIAIRLAIGVGRRRLIRQLLVESAVLFTIGGVGGILLAYWLTGVLARSLPILPATLSLDVSPDPRVLLIALATAALTGIVFGLAPALHAANADMMNWMRTGVPIAGSRMRGRRVFVAAQFAMSVMLIVIAGLFIRSVRAAANTDTGFDPDGVLVADIDLRPHGYDTDRTRSFWKDILDRVRALPGVEQAGLAQWPLLAGGSSNGSDVRTEQTGTAEPNRTNARFDPVDAAWFDVLRVPVIAGRGFNESDDAAAPPVIIINETLAARLWPGENPLGRVVLGAGAPREVVGITRAGKYVFIGEPPTSIVFFPYEQRLPGRMTLHVRARVTAGAGLIERIRAEVLAIDPDIAIENTGSLSAMVGVSMFPLRFAASLIGGFGLAGLILAMIGVYGVLAFEVARSTREFGIRGALGARARDLIGAIVARGLAVAAVGTAAGIGIAVAVTRFIRGFLYGVGPLDPLTFVAAGLLMLAVAVAAAWLPARRASSVPPIVALRAE